MRQLLKWTHANAMVGQASVISYEGFLSKADLMGAAFTARQRALAIGDSVFFELGRRGELFTGESCSICRGYDRERLRDRGTLMRRNRDARRSGAQDIYGSRFQSFDEIAVAQRTKPHAVGVTAMVHVERMLLSGRRRVVSRHCRMRAGRVLHASSRLCRNCSVAIVNVRDQRLYRRDANPDQRHTGKDSSNCSEGDKSHADTGSHPDSSGSRRVFCVADLDMFRTNSRTFSPEQGWERRSSEPSPQE